MDRETASETARSALEREGFKNTDETFALSSVDAVTRWVVARALETQAKRTFPDTAISKAATVSDLLDLAEEAG